MVARLNRTVIAIKGGGEMATGIAWRLHKANFQYLYIMEIPKPLAVRRRVSFCEAVYNGHHTVEGVTAIHIYDSTAIEASWQAKQIPVITDPTWQTLKMRSPQVLVDAILAKHNLGTTTDQAPLVIGLGPGFEAGKDAHMVVETLRGHDLGRVLTTGCATPNTGVPGNIAGFHKERVLRAPTNGLLLTINDLGDVVCAGDTIGTVAQTPFKAEVSGVLRGLLRSQTYVEKGLKIGDIDPRGEKSCCYTISEKALALGGAVLEAILRRFNV